MGEHRLEGTIDELAASNIKEVRFRRLLAICEEYFGPARVRGSHHIFKTPWPGEPFVNLQVVQGGKSKPYQVRQVIAALERLREVRNASR